MSRQIVLSISLLVSNRIKSIRKCMESLNPILKAIPSELIAVDTGSTDGSIDIVKEYTDKVISFEWCDDFSKARNTGLKEASGEWFMYIDDDEWFEDPEPIINFFVSGEYKNYGRALYRVRNYHDSEGKEYGEGYVGRLSRRATELEFKGTVHEGLYPVYEPCKSLDCFVHHYGYAYKNDGERIKHANRNIELLLKATSDNADFRLKAQLLQEYRAVKNYAECEKLCEEALEAYEQDKKHPFIQWMLATYVRLYNAREQWIEALSKAEELEKSVEFNAMGRLILSASAMTAAYNCGKSKAGLSWVEKYLSEAKEINENREAYGEILIFDSLSFITEKNIKEAEGLKAYFDCCKTPVLSISVLVSNSRDTIEKSVKSLEKLRREIPSELIIVDTGGTDGAIDIAEAYADKVVKFEWTDDFAMARNAGLKEACGEWFMFLDDDEWFENTDVIIEFFKSGEYKQYGRASYLVRNYEDMSGEKYGEYYIARMSRRTNELVFKGRVHEWLEPVFDNTKYLSCFAHHYGYARILDEQGNVADDRQQKKRAERNIALILEELKDRPDDFRMYAQLLQEYKASDRNTEALELCEKIYAKYLTEQDKMKPLRNAFEEWIIASWVRMYDSNRSSEALKTAALLDKEVKFNAFGKMLHTAAAFLAAKAAECAQAVISYAEEYLNCIAEVKKTEKLDELMIADSKKYASEDFKENVVQELMSVCIVHGEYDRLAEYRKSYGAHDEYLLEQIFETASNIPNFWEELHKERYEYCFAIMIKSHGIDAVSEKLDRIREYIKICRPELLLYSDMLLYEEKLVKKQENTENIKIEELYSYAGHALAYYREIYADIQFDEAHRKNLPRNCRFAILIEEGRQAEEKGNISELLGKLKSAAKVYPVLLLSINVALKNYTEKSSGTDKLTANIEFKLMASQLKQKIGQLIEGGECKEAVLIIEELSKLMPGDKELSELMERAK